ncbi:MAG: hypothetical protein ACI9ZT_000582 [Gammaproteobacteria bacterium]
MDITSNGPGHQDGVQARLYRYLYYIINSCLEFSGDPKDTILYSISSCFIQGLGIVNEISVKLFVLTTAILGLFACSQETPQILITVADARDKPAQTIDQGVTGDSVGDILTFDQPLLDEAMNEIGNNSGICIRTHVGHNYQCQWTLTLDNGTIQVAGRELDQGTSIVSIVGGTGKYSGITGEMESTNNNNGTFTQKLYYSIKR